MVVRICWMRGEQLAVVIQIRGRPLWGSPLVVVKIRGWPLRRPPVAEGSDSAAGSTDTAPTSLAHANLDCAL